MSVRARCICFVVSVFGLESVRALCSTLSLARYEEGGGGQILVLRAYEHVRTKAAIIYLCLADSTWVHSESHQARARPISTASYNPRAKPIEAQHLLGGRTIGNIDARKAYRAARFVPIYAVLRRHCSARDGRTIYVNMTKVVNIL